MANFPCCPPCGPPQCSPCGPCQPCFGSVSLPTPAPQSCLDPYSLTPCCGPIPCEPPQMMVAYRRPYSRIPGKEEYQCYPCYFKLPKPCNNICCPPKPFNPLPPCNP